MPQVGADLSRERHAQQLREDDRREAGDQPPPHQLAANPEQEFDARAQPISGDRGGDHMDGAAQRLFPGDEHNGGDHPRQKSPDGRVAGRLAEAHQTWHHQDEINATIVDALTCEKARR
jgi:hypothetical protein